IKNGEFKDAANNLTFANSSLKGQISNGAANKAASSQIVLNWFSTELNKGKIEGKLNIENFIQPHYSFSGTMAVKLADAAALFKWNDLKKAEGSIASKLQLSGSLQSTETYTLKDWKRSKVSGDISLNDIAFYYGNGPQYFNNIRGNFKLDNNNVEVKSMHAAVNQSAFELKGRFNNLIGYLLEEDENIMIDAALSSSAIRLEDFLLSGQDEDTSTFQLEISPRINLYLQTEIDYLSFKTFELNRLMGQFVVRNEQIDFRNIHFESNGGEVDGELFIRENGSKLNTFAKLDFKAINIQSLFQSFNNFGQESLMAENINGKASATIDYSCVWSKSLLADLNSLKIESNLFIENGELINYKPLESLSKFVELEELKHIRFKHLNNHILIKDRKVFIPRFDVNSSALNVGIAGSHSFDNEIDYKFTLLLNEILGKKAKKPKSNEFGYVEDDGLGRTKLFLKMTGTVDNPDISYDKEQLKTH
ncbi:MAG: AsmA-like C-terminal region-containing protein, partial [Vicingaceae bacterium]